MGQLKKHLPVNPAPHPKSYTILVRDKWLGFTRCGVKLVVGFIFQKESILSQAESILVKCFGKIDFASPILPFTHTAYYEKEFDKDLKRKFIGFQKLIPPQQLSKIKITTNKIEERLSGLRGRLINIDPGYLNLAKLILASTKDYKHRVYLNNGIYAEVTLFYQDKSFRFWEWTYPDYKTIGYIEIFNQIRKIYAQQIKNK